MTCRFSPVLLCLVLLNSALTLSAEQNEKTASLTIVVMDPGGAVIPNALVALSRLPKFPPLKLEADKDGTVKAKLMPGEYDLLVTAQSFASSKKQVQVNQSENKKITVILRVASGGGVEVGPASAPPR
jgi:uncharacterized membrane protein